MQQPDAFTVYMAIVAACLALSLVWLVVARTFPTLHAARFWFAGTLAASLGIGLTWWRSLDPLAPILAGNGFVLLGSGLGWLGVRQFVGKSTPWLPVLGTMAATIAGLAFATLVYDSLALRVVIFSAAQSVLIGWAVVDILDRKAGGTTPGSLLAAGACCILLALNAARTVLAVVAGGSAMPVLANSQLQATLVFLVAVFGALVCQFGFLLMTMDRLQAEMLQLTGVDDLTGVANRRRLLAACEQECVRSVRTGRTFSILVIDVDCFKAINDSHGHATGDEFLRTFAGTASGQLRAQDLLARIGGDEFCVLMPETDGQQAAKTAERLAAAVRETRVAHGGEMIGSTISVGVAQWSPAIGRQACALLDVADKALYLTKNAGRDGVTLASMPVPQPSEPLAA